MGSFESSRESVSNLLDAANKEILIYDGHFDSEIYQHPSVIPHLKSAVSRDVKIEVICDSTAQIVEPGIQALVEDGG